MRRSAAAPSFDLTRSKEQNMRLRLAILAVALCAAGAAALVAALAASANQPPLEQARNATAAFHDIATLPADYGVLKDKNGIACIDMPAMAGMPAGAMGIHYVNGVL